MTSSSAFLKPSVVAIALGAVAIAGLASAQSPPSTPQPPAIPNTAVTPTAEDDILRLLTLLERSGLRYEKADGSVWVTTFQGEHRDTIRVHISVFGKLALVQSLVAEDPALDLTQAIQAMKLSFMTDLAKVGIDREGDLIVLNESELRLLDAEGLRTIVEAVAAFSDALFAAISGTALSAETAATPVAPATSTEDATLHLLQKRASLRLDGRLWTANATDDASTTELTYASGDLWARVIEERIEIPLARLEEIALANARRMDPKLAVTRRGSRVVNGLPMSVLEFEGANEGIRFRFLGHYFSDASGTVQIIAWTTSNLFDEHRPAIEQLASGFQKLSRD